MPDRRNASTYSFPYCGKRSQWSNITARMVMILNENVPLKQLKELNACQMTGEEKKLFLALIPRPWNGITLQNEAGVVWSAV